MAKNGMHSRKRASLRIKVQVGDAVIGPGKVELLRQIDQLGGISSAARAMGMSYRRAWHLLDTLAKGLGAPLVETSVGGSGGGGAQLTPLGRRLVDEYGTAIKAADKAARPLLDWLGEGRSDGAARDD
ncbi:MAG: LysR family transcriptional regulator [Rhodospirillales bacterium]